MTKSLVGQLVHVRDQLFPRQCSRKIRYAAEYAALGVKRDRERAGSPPLNVYRCPHCDGWHLTKFAQARAEDFA